MCDCKQCRACKERARRKANPELYRTKERERYKRDREKRLEQAKAWRSNNLDKVYENSRKSLARLETLKNKPCLDCNNAFPPECMDFDHRNPMEKEAGVGHLIATRAAWNRILIEIDKCDLVCANCHRIRTKKRLTETREVRLANVRSTLPQMRSTNH